MRLTCPNCGVEYEVPEASIAPAGRHVQCTSCHTRWFVRAPVTVSEEQILTRLEGWSPRPRPVLVPDREPEPEAEGGAGNFLWEGPDAEPEELPRPKLIADPPSRPAGPAKPSDRPTVPQPAPVAVAAPPARPVPRLGLDAELPVPPAMPRRTRFGRGLLLALVLFGAALGAYRFRTEVIAQAPATAPALQAYGAWVDLLRDEVERRIAPLREAAGS